MTEHDRILDAFRNCITEPKYKDCPWTECEELDNRKIKIPADLALSVMRELVAQEPRVLTLEEIIGIYEFRESHVWVYNTPPYLYLDNRNWIGYWVSWSSIVMCIDGQEPEYTRDTYGIKWRCWTYRPSDEQRRNTPWE